MNIHRLQTDHSDERPKRVQKRHSSREDASENFIPQESKMASSVEERSFRWPSIPRNWLRIGLAAGAVLGGAAAIYLNRNRLRAVLA